jgi:hypothetical protein
VPYLYIDHNRYYVSVKTGSTKGAGTDNDVSLLIFGTEGKSAKMDLNNFWKNDFESGHTDDFKFDADDVGQIEYIAIAMKPTLPFKDSWYINTITIGKLF